MWSERFPYANFHELNLDWVLIKLKDLIDKYNLHDTEINEIKVEIEKLKEAIDLIGDVDKIEELIQEYDTIKQQVEVNTSDIGVLKLAMSTLNTDMTNLQQSFTELETKLDGQIEQINQNLNLIQTDINNIKNDVSQIQTSITNITTEISQITKELTTITESISNINTVNEQQNTKIQNLQEGLNATNTKVSTLEETVASFDSEQGTINETLQNKLNELTNKTGELETTTNTLVTITSTIQEDLTNLTDLYNELSTELTGVKTNVQTNTNNISTLQTNVSQLQNSLQTLAGKSWYGVNLKNLGFVCDGVTDESAKLNALPRGIYLVEGVLLVASTVTFNHAISFIGMTEYSAIHIVNKNQFRCNGFITMIKGLQIYSEFQTRSHLPLLDFYGGVVIDECFLYRSDGAFITVHHAENSAVWITNNDFADNFISILLDTNLSSFISNNRFTPTSEYGIYIENDVDNQVSTVNIHNNEMYNQVNNMQIHTNTAGTISGNSFEGCTDVNVRMYTAAQQSTVAFLANKGTAWRTADLAPTVIFRGNSWQEEGGGGSKPWTFNVSGITVRGSAQTDQELTIYCGSVDRNTSLTSIKITLNYNNQPFITNNLFYGYILGITGSAVMLGVTFINSNNEYTIFNTSSLYNSMSGTNFGSGAATMSGDLILKAIH